MEIEHALVSNAECMQRGQMRVWKVRPSSLLDKRREVTETILEQLERNR